MKISQLKWNDPNEKPEEGQPVFVATAFGSFKGKEDGICSIHERYFREFKSNGKKRKNPFGVSRKVTGWLPIPYITKICKETGKTYFDRYIFQENVDYN